MKSNAEIKPIALITRRKETLLFDKYQGKNTYYEAIYIRS